MVYTFDTFIVFFQKKNNLKPLLKCNQRLRGTAFENRVFLAKFYFAAVGFLNTTFL